MFAMISSPPANDIKQKVDFQEKWHQEKMQLLKQAEAYGISEPFNAPKIFSRRIDNVTAVEVSLKDLAVLTFQFNRDKYRWKIVKIDIAEGPVAERHRINEKFYRQLKPLFDRYYYLVDWSDWLREAEEPEALQKYWQDILGVQKQLQEISPPQEATELYKAFQEALSKLEEATRAQIKFVSLKNDLADKLKETVQTMEDINLLEERLEEQLEQSNESYMIGTMRQTLENLKEEIRTELENLQDKSYQLGEADREQLLLQFEELHRQFLSEKAVYEEFVGRTAGL
ncbi:hypothetical protein KKC1_28520 [Calderihabitans maritimus]|uniref:Uncharacterized protein n=2 Tax=Calderihabitans maritimus TaxID=1246530 RepID=A0A1Z5HW35_9FIRM|nr:hypothetical protein KKC1_28520 [Calderihabitans maritimus]